MENHKNFWTVPKVSPFYAQHCPLNSFGHNFNRFCGISFQNLKSRFFAVFWSPNFTWNICKNSKKVLMTPKIGQKLPLIFPVKVIKSQIRTLSHLKMIKFTGLGGVNLTPPKPDRVKMPDYLLKFRNRKFR